MREKFIFFFFFFLININLNAQNSGAYLIPRQIFVGDPAALVLPLPPPAQINNDIVFSDKDELPYHENIDFHKIILEQRAAGSRLIIEFTAFVPGVITLPVIEINGEEYSGLSITVNSVIESRSDRLLSEAAPALAMPGTALMIYGSMAGLIIIIIGVIWFLLKGRAVLKDLRENWKRFRLFSGIRNTEKKLRREFQKGTEKRFILDELSDETRNFLSILTNKNCRSMTAGEFDTLAILVANDALLTAKLPEPAPDALPVVRFGNFFHRCDEYRFSGINAGEQDIFCLLDDLVKYVDILERAKKNEKKEKAA